MAQILDGRSILKTGGESGIGRAVALRSAEAEAAITVTDVNVEAGRGVADEVVRIGGQAQLVRLDVSDGAQHHSAAVKAFGKLDGSCNAVGKPFQGRPMHEIDTDFWGSVYALNLRSVFFATRAQVPATLDVGKGSIVNVASTTATAAFPGGADYCAAKGGIVSATRAAALDYAKLGIRVNSVLPGATRTPMTQRQMDAFDGIEDTIMVASPMGRFAEPDEIAYAVRWLLSDEAGCVTGTVMIVDGGLIAA